MKWLPAIGLFIAAMVCVVLAQQGDNTDARALAGIFWLPAIGFSLCAPLFWRR